MWLKLLLLFGSLGVGQVAAIESCYHDGSEDITFTCPDGYYCCEILCCMSWWLIALIVICTAVSASVSIFIAYKLYKLMMRPRPVVMVTHNVTQVHQAPGVQGQHMYPAPGVVQGQQAYGDLGMQQYLPPSYDSVRQESSETSSSGKY